MDSKTFLAESARTVSTQFRTDVVPTALLLARLKGAARAAAALDAVKKGLFYGKPLTGAHAEAADLYAHGEQPALPEGITPDLIHAVIGIFTEAGEMLEAVLKVFEGQPLDKVNLEEELGDKDWYAAMIYRELGVLPEEVWELVIAKLRKRYPDRFTAEAAINRDVDAERKILENGRLAAE